MRDVGDADAGGSESLLIGARELRDVSECGDRDGALNPVGAESGHDPLPDPQDIDACRDGAVLEVPPNRDLHISALFFVVPPRR